MEISSFPLHAFMAALLFVARMLLETAMTQSSTLQMSVEMNLHVEENVIWFGTSEYMEVQGGRTARGRT